ncbi:MAG: UvrD-helicase domain-containing protein [Gammaproteobacteria bacterium]
MTVIDQKIREEALDPSRSFIVQAPAGSGKTELLMQRYLALLATVENPEEVIAITFTRKATAEMRGRILGALENAASSQKPDQVHHQKTWQLAQQVLIRDETHNWNLQQNPNRLQIQTIDAMCAGLARRMPVLSRAGVNPQTIESADVLYQKAARATLQELPKTKEIGVLLAHLDNNWQKLELMITNLLQKRDHWLRHLPINGELQQERENLQASLCAIISQTLEQTYKKVPATLIEEWIGLSNYAAENLLSENKKTPLTVCAGLTQWPEVFPKDLHLWEGLIELVLTKDNKWRKSVTKSLGFPVPSGEQKQLQAEMKLGVINLIETLSGQPDLIDNLQAIRQLPKPGYSEDQWQVLESLFVVLKLAVAQLQIVFREQGQVDFTEVSIAAVYALGHAEQPTDLALALDYKIKHLLVDEFQDTSISQYSLLEKITVGWEIEDGRTLFLVGDPMQSIYRFREADVGLFINVQQRGVLGHVPLTSLQLTVNFRSNYEVVEWVNHTFQRAMPAQNSVTSGAVSYTSSQAFHPSESGAYVSVHPLIDTDKKQAALLVCDLVRQAVKREKSTAVLVRSKSHLLQITSALKEQNLSYQAVEIETLAQQPVINDLRSLTCALLHLADKISWLSILRAPWCGLTLDDLEALTGRSNLSVWSLLNDDQKVNSISNDGKKRILRLRSIINKALSQRQRFSLSRWVEGVWISLGGPACLENDSDFDNANSFFELLNQLEDARDLSSVDILDLAIKKLFASPEQVTDQSVQLMTIHKAKGLEFDIVILPALERHSKNDERQLLQWIEWHNAEENANELLLAPIEETGREKEPINQYLSLLEKERSRHETVRLLYVAATRAKQQLHLIGRVEYNAKGELKSPDQRSLLARIWPSVKDQFEEKEPQIVEANSVDDSAENFTSYINRLTSDWVLPESSEVLDWEVEFVDKKKEKQTEKNQELEFIWAGAPARHIGTVVHRLLQQVAEEGLDRWDQQRIGSITPLIETLLLESGLSKVRLSAAVKKVTKSINQTLQDDRGRWVLCAQNQQAKSEYSLTGVVDGELINIIIDRTFIDQNGTRWIIDYKTGSHEGGDLEGFLDNEQLRYREQLERYAKMITNLEKRPIKLALYFPQFSGWREWSFQI